MYKYVYIYIYICVWKATACSSSVIARAALVMKTLRELYKREFDRVPAQWFALHSTLQYRLPIPLKTPDRALIASPEEGCHNVFVAPLFAEKRTPLKQVPVIIQNPSPENTQGTPREACSRTLGRSLPRRRLFFLVLFICYGYHYY